jgi:plastocyanin
MTLMPVRSKTRNLILAVIFGLISAVLLSTLSIGLWSSSQSAEAIGPKGVTREFYLTNMDNPKMNETITGLPADIYNIPEMTVKKGDTVLIHFYNLEPETADRHSFTFLTGPYVRNVALDGGQNQTIVFTANQTGIFKYVCVYHMPSMTGQLVVAPYTIDEFRVQQREEQQNEVNSA